MIETTQTVQVAAPIGATWAYAQDVERWAEIMPGYQSCEIVDADNSLWVLKIGVGAMVRTVKVEVHVSRWAGPEEVDFSFKLRGDPVTGQGTYRARAQGPALTELDLHVEVVGTGPLAPMWEAMGGPVLPKFSRSFAEELKGRIEAANQGTATSAEAQSSTPAAPTGSLWTRFTAWLRRLLGG